MSHEPTATRRKAIVAVGAAGLGVLGVGRAKAATQGKGKEKEGKFARMKTAVTKMHAAKKYLEEAPDIYGGYKQKSIDALKTAIDEVEDAVKFAEKKT